MADSWVILAEHMLQLSWNPIDPGGLDLLFLEGELISQGIEAAFDPFRPGEGGGYTKGAQQPVRLLVKEADLDRARQIARDVLGSQT